MSASWVASRASSGWPVTRRHMACTRSRWRARRISRAPRSPALAAAARASSLASPLGRLMSRADERPSGVDGDLGHLDLVAAVDRGQRREPDEDVATLGRAEVEAAGAPGAAGLPPAGQIRACPLGDEDRGDVPGGGGHVHAANLPVATEIDVDTDAGLELREV